MIKMVIVKFASLEDLLLMNPSSINQYGDVCFTATVASDFIVVWRAPYKGELKRFIKLEDDMTLVMSDSFKRGWVPVTHVTDVLMMSGPDALQQLRK